MSNAIIRLLARYPGQYVSGAKMSEELKVSRTAVWKQIRKLENEGYEFEASTKLGYRLISAPERIDPQELQSKLTTTTFGRRLNIYDAIDSTQDKARFEAENGAPEGTLFIAEQQLNGRGRMGRGWISPKGKGIWMSLVLRPTVPIHCAPQLTLLTAVALCRSLTRITELNIGIKWPNDLLIDGKKISGILLESAAEDERLKYVIAGIGISVNLVEADYPPELLAKAVSLRMAAGRQWNRTSIISEFLQEWETLYSLYQEQGFHPIVSLWEALSVSLGKPARLLTPQGEIAGTPVALEESGAIRIKLEDGSEVPVYSAEMGEPIPSE